MADERYLTAKDIREILGISKSRAYEILNEMTCVVFGKSIRVSQEAFDRWVRAHEQPPAPPRSTLTPTGRAKLAHWQRETGQAVGADGMKPIRRMKPRPRAPGRETRRANPCEGSAGRGSGEAARDRAYSVSPPAGAAQQRRSARLPHRECARTLEFRRT